jgi:O-antigen/teichoic acid export membrane protein
MNTTKRLTKNVSISFISQLISYFLGFFILVYTARYLGVEGFGILSFALAITGIFTVLLDLGLSTLLVREIARNKKEVNDYIPNISSIKILLAIFTLGIIFVFLCISGYDEQTIQVVLLITIYTIFTAFSQVYYALFQAFEKLEYQSIGSILAAILLFIGILMAIFFNFNIVQFSFVYVVVGIVMFLYILILFLNKFDIPKLKFDTSKWKSYLLEAWPFAITGISINLYLYVDTIILSQIKGPDAVGLYNAAYRLIYVLFFIPIVFNNAFFPLMSRYYISSKFNLKFVTQKFVKIMVILGFPIGIFMVLFSNKIINLIYGNQFVGSIMVLQILILSCLMIFIRSPFERVLESSNRQLSITKIFIIGLLINIILNLIFIPFYSFIGAAIITVLTDFIILCLLIFLTRDFKILKSEKLIVEVIKIFLASIIMGIILTFLNQLNIFYLMIIGSIIYLILIFIFKIINEDEILLIKSVF